MNQVKLLAWHNDPEIKAKHIARYKEHMRLDQVIQGTGYENGKGCFVGCTLDEYNHNRFPTDIGWPLWLAHLADSLFERCEDNKQAAEFGLELMEAVEPGVELDKVKYAVALGFYKRSLERLKDNQEDFAVKVKDAIQGAINWIEAGAPEETREAVMSAAWSAEDSTWSAWSAVESSEQRQDLLTAIKNLSPLSQVIKALN